MEKEFLETAVGAARLAGDVLRDWAGKFTVREKSRANLVTQADLCSQRAIHEHIRRRFPDHGFLGEEGLREGGGRSPYRWVIDPLDGTSNYVHGFPFYAVSIALECGRELLVGVIYDPTRDELFSAIRGGGAWLNDAAISPSPATPLSAALVVVSLPVGIGADHPAVARMLKVLPAAQHVQRTGSAALNLAYVASGRIDAFWSTSLHPWDMAAGALIVQEAGGRVTRLDGGPLDIEVPSLLASNGSQVHEELRQLLAS